MRFPPAGKDELTQLDQSSIQRLRREQEQSQLQSPQTNLDQSQVALHHECSTWRRAVSNRRAETLLRRQLDSHSSVLGRTERRDRIHTLLLRQSSQKRSAT